MRKKVAKKLKKMAALLTQTKPDETRAVYQRLKKVHNEIKKGK